MRNKFVALTTANCRVFFQNMSVVTTYREVGQHVHSEVFYPIKKAAACVKVEHYKPLTVSFRLVVSRSLKLPFHLS